MLFLAARLDMGVDSLRSVELFARKALAGERREGPWEWREEAGREGTEPLSRNMGFTEELKFC